MRANFSFRRVSEVMEGVRLQGMRATVSKTNLQVRSITNNGIVVKKLYEVCKNGEHYKLVEKVVRI